ncbi:MAG: glycosyltransferase family 4 protein [Magnetococcales bacterium]|nr:glycosyltransferase family 4 protein [Magnetococcales bacterium]
MLLHLIVIVLSALGSMVVSLFVNYRLSHSDSQLSSLDHPNHRSLHDTPTPRSGGLAILAGMVPGCLSLTFLLSSPPGLGWLLLGFLIVSGLSFLDDHRDLSPLVRLLVQFLAASMIVVGGFELTIVSVGSLSFRLPETLAILTTLFSTVWMLNLYNFMDGMDGFAGGMGMFGFWFLSLFGLFGDNTFYSGVALVIALSNTGFLALNFPPAKIFMGDVGSVGMGYAAAALTLWGVQDGLFDLWVPLLIFSPFIVDASYTLGRRLLKREKVWQAHRSHYYQWLVRRGWGHRKTVLAEYLLMGSCGISALWLHSGSTITILQGLLAWGLFYLALILWRHQFASNSEEE